MPTFVLPKGLLFGYNATLSSTSFQWMKPYASSNESIASSDESIAWGVHKSQFHGEFLFKWCCEYMTNIVVCSTYWSQLLRSYSHLGSFVSTSNFVAMQWVVNRATLVLVVLPLVAVKQLPNFCNRNLFYYFGPLLTWHFYNIVIQLECGNLSTKIDSWGPQWTGSKEYRPKSRSWLASTECITQSLSTVKHCLQNHANKVGKSFRCSVTSSHYLATITIVSSERTRWHSLPLALNLFAMVVYIVHERKIAEMLGQNFRAMTPKV